MLNHLLWWKQSSSINAATQFSMFPVFMHPPNNFEWNSYRNSLRLYWYFFGRWVSLSQESEAFQSITHQQNISVTNFLCRIHSHLVSTYESGSTRRYRNGRVDNIRAASSEALNWCEAMTGKTQATAEEKMLLLRKSIKAQNDFMVQVIDC